ncbi:SMI1/KNR4 family protein [Paenibacillus sp. LHD-117]|uniref:SMI1/KNR4 family protein n=1 Tax=Paenibacillus sp. LHD-117 TaxID=3071412 RepID=UPI0027E14AA9|nr:SMI1/KNR4 family protein [Paenibacillus sp. LHD-117]MDQ6418010.1 SMI1/KNR4 family protein [Paenibacillus sp. LHD-117]
MDVLIKLISSRKPGVEIQDIKNTEEVLGVKLPEQYKKLVGIVNQPEIDEWILYPIKDSMRLSNTYDDIVRNNTGELWPENTGDYISIAYDGTGDLLCYKLIDDSRELGEEIFYWNHEEDTFELILNYESITL